MRKLDMLVQQFNKDFKEDIASKGIARITTEKIPFSSPRLNYMLYGGLPRNKLIEFSGDENSGKTTSALDAVKNAQILFVKEWEDDLKQLKAIKKPTKGQETRLQYLTDRGPKQITYIDCENTLDEDWAKKIGVDVDNMYVIKPQTQSAEDIFEMTLSMIETDELGLVIIDSLGVMLSAQAFEKSMSEKTYGGISQALTLFSKKAEVFCAKHACTLIGINQMREDLNSQFNKQITTGGKAWKHNCILRVQFRKGNFIDKRGNELNRQAEEPHGNLVEAHIVKTKCCKPDRLKGFYTLNYSAGVDSVSDLVDVGEKLGVVSKVGSWYKFVDTDTGEILEDENGDIIKLQGKANLVQYLKNTDWVLEELTNNVSSLLTT